MSVLARQRIRGARVQITRPALVRQPDGSRTRVGAVDGVDPEPTVIQDGVRVELASITVERKEHVFGVTSKATDTIRIPIAWNVREGDVLEVQSGPETGSRFRVERCIAYRGRARISHAECALVALPVGAR